MEGLPSKTVDLAPAQANGSLYMGVCRNQGAPIWTPNSRALFLRTPRKCKLGLISEGEGLGLSSRLPNERRRQSLTAHREPDTPSLRNIS